MKRKTQKELILEHMQNYGGITTMEAFRLYGCTRLSARIGELENDGYYIGGIRIKVPDRNGQETEVKRYFIIGRRPEVG